jgi:UDP-2,3-diacylglucosamine pyrophosphatase LpxH
MKRPVDIVVLSDVHLGTYGCHAEELLSYLKSIKPKVLILNGDIVDIWQFRKYYFPKEHIEVINRIMKMSLSETKVYYLIGNHDDTLRRFMPYSAGNIHLRDKLILQFEGKKYWFFHGDIFDVSIKYSRFLAKLGGQGYDLLIRFNRLVNNLRHRLSMPRISIASNVKMGVKKAVKFIRDFEETAIDLAIKQKYDYVVCGHIHKPEIREAATAQGKVTYMNSGDWVENLTSLELVNGKWQIYRYEKEEFDLLNKKLSVKGSMNTQPEPPVPFELEMVNLPDEM